MANLLLSVMGAIADFERELIKERQREGIAIHGWLVDVEILNEPAEWVM